MTPKGDSQGLSFFGPRQARLLSKLLTHTQLPGLSSLDQMHLLAMADTVASCKIDLADRFAIDAARYEFMAFLEFSLLFLNYCLFFWTLQIFFFTTFLPTMRKSIFCNRKMFSLYLNIFFFRKKWITI